MTLPANNDGLLAPGPLRIAGITGLGRQPHSGSLARFQATGPSPALHFTSDNSFPVGHYRIVFAFKGRLEDLALARMCIGTDEGFPARLAVGLVLEATKNGRIEAVFAVSEPAQVLRLDLAGPVDSKGLELCIGAIRISRYTRLGYYLNLMRKATTGPLAATALTAGMVVRALHHGPAGVAQELTARRREQTGLRRVPPPSHTTYAEWIHRHDTITPADRTAMARLVTQFTTRPTISVILPVYNTPADLLSAAIDSVLDQSYPDWELCIADDASTALHVRPLLERYAASDPRIRVTFRDQNGHISRASNSALALATGDWAALLDHDDILPPHALFCMAEAINDNPQGRLFYSDEDKIDPAGQRIEPHFKSDWNPRLFLEQNMISHLGVYHLETVRQIGGFREGFEGSQDQDLALQFVERVQAEQIIHIPHVLYHWRIVPGSTALSAGEKDYALKASVRAVADALMRRGAEGSVMPHTAISHAQVRYDLPHPAPTVCLHVIGETAAEIADCVTSILALTDYASYEIVLTGCTSEEFTSAATRLPQGFDRLVRFVDSGESDLVCQLSASTRIVSADWLTRLVSEVSQPGIGAAGPKILYRDQTVRDGPLLLGSPMRGAFDGKPFADPGYFGRALLTGEWSALTSNGLVVRRDVFEAIRNCAADDLSQHIRASGFRLVWVPDACLMDLSPAVPAALGTENGSDPAYNPNLSQKSAPFTLLLNSTATYSFRRLQDATSSSGA